jgi:hypothetical protein
VGEGAQFEHAPLIIVIHFLRSFMILLYSVINNSSASVDT